jgi:hypothetical protein
VHGIDAQGKVIIRRQLKRRYVRLFTVGAPAVIRYAKIHGTKHRPWLAALLARPNQGCRDRTC